MRKGLAGAVKAAQAQQRAAAPPARSCSGAACAKSTALGPWTTEEPETPPLPKFKAKGEMALSACKAVHEQERETLCRESEARQLELQSKIELLSGKVSKHEQEAFEAARQLNDSEGRRKDAERQLAEVQAALNASQAARNEVPLWAWNCSHCCRLGSFHCGAHAGGDGLRRVCRGAGVGPHVAAGAATHMFLPASGASAWWVEGLCICVAWCVEEASPARACWSDVGVCSLTLHCTLAQSTRPAPHVAGAVEDAWGAAATGRAARRSSRGVGHAVPGLDGLQRACSLHCT